MELKVDFTGWDELKGKFSELEAGMRKKIAQKAVRKRGQNPSRSCKNLSSS